MTMLDVREVHTFPVVLDAVLRILGSEFAKEAFQLRVWDHAVLMAGGYQFRLFSTDHYFSDRDAFPTYPNGTLLVQGVGPNQTTVWYAVRSKEEFSSLVEHCLIEVAQIWIDQSTIIADIKKICGIWWWLFARTEKPKRAIVGGYLVTWRGLGFALYHGRVVCNRLTPASQTLYIVRSPWQLYWVSHLAQC